MCSQPDPPSGKGMITCGDDKGCLWLYYQPQFGKDGAAPVKDTIEPSNRLMWPELQDDHLENSRKIPIDRHDIIIDKVAASHDNTHIVAVTSNNMASKALKRRRNVMIKDAVTGVREAYSAAMCFSCWNTHVRL